MGESLKDKILKALEESGKVDKKRLKDTEGKARGKNGSSTINALVDSGIVSGLDLLTILSLETGIPPVDMSKINLDTELMDLVSEKLIRRHSVVPLSRIVSGLTIAISDPTDIFVLDDIQTITGCSVVPVLATREDLQKTINGFYEEGGKEVEEVNISDIVGEDDESAIEVVDGAEGLDLVDITEESTKAPIVKMVDVIIMEAIKKRASDIHIEPQERSLIVRYRIDGKMHAAFELPKRNQNAILARIKIMSNLDITETRMPQDGRFRIKLAKKEIDFRVSMLPTSCGNKAVLRALDKSSISVGLDILGFLPGPLEDFKTALSRPFGIILVTGPTGSGKSTTLYSVLDEMNTPEKNIITIEDPVEYQVEGITQIAARPEIGLDFSSGLKSILRQSPDVIMVGEIRDFETADIAIKASLTGQMVLSTLHTNDSVGAITRLVDMGIEPFLISASLVMACAQRLLRGICQHCKVEDDLPSEALEEIRKNYPEFKDVNKFYKGSGCPKCDGSGYSGRMGTLETLLINDELREMISERKTEDKIKEYLRSKGVKTLRDNAMVKFFNGLTTLEEVYRVT